MNIKTKFSINQEVFFFFKDKIIHEPIKEIEIIIHSKYSPIIRYAFEFGNPESLTKIVLFEYKVYETSTDALDYLKENITDGFGSF